MAVAPITWRNVPAPDFTGVANITQQAGNNIAGGFDKLANLGQQIQQTNIAAEDAETKTQTDTVLAAINNIRTQEDYAAAQSQGAFNPETLSKQFPQADVRAVVQALQAKDQAITEQTADATRLGLEQQRTQAAVQSADLRNQEAQTNLANQDKISVFNQLVNADDVAKAREYVKTTPGLPANAMSVVDQRASELSTRAVDTLFKDLTATQAERKSATQSLLDSQTYSADPRNLFKVNDNGSVTFTKEATEADKLTANTALTESLTTINLGEITDNKILDRVKESLSKQSGISSKAANDLISGYKTILDSNEGLSSVQQEAYAAEESRIAEVESTQLGMAKLDNEANLAKYPVGTVETLKTNVKDMADVTSKLGELFRVTLGFDDPADDEQQAMFRAINQGKNASFTAPVSVDLAGNRKEVSINSLPAWAIQAAGAEIIPQTSISGLGFNFTTGEAETLGKRIVERAKEFAIQDRQEAYNADIRNELSKEYTNTAIKIKQDNLQARKSALADIKSRRN